MTEKCPSLEEINTICISKEIATPWCDDIEDGLIIFKTKVCPEAVAPEPLGKCHITFALYDRETQNLINKNGGGCLALKFGSNSSLLPIINNSIAHLKEGEHAWVHGNRTLCLGDITGYKDCLLSISLLRVSKPTQIIRNTDFSSCKQEALKHYDAGKELIKTALGQSVKAFNRCIACWPKLEVTDTWTPEERNEVKELILKCRKNLSYCYLKNAHYDKCRALCLSLIEEYGQDKCPKVIFRYARSLDELGYFTDALEQYKRADAMCTEDALIRYYLTEVQRKLKKKNNFKFVFDKMNLEDDAENIRCLDQWQIMEKGSDPALFDDLGGELSEVQLNWDYDDCFPEEEIALLQNMSLYHEGKDEEIYMVNEDAAGWDEKEKEAFLNENARVISNWNKTEEEREEERREKESNTLLFSQVLDNQIKAFKESLQGRENLDEDELHMELQNQVNACVEDKYIRTAYPPIQIHKIKRVAWEMTIDDQFCSRGEYYSFREYYKEKYDMELTRDELPMVMIEIKLSNKRRLQAGVDTMDAYYPAECIYIVDSDVFFV